MLPDDRTRRSAKLRSAWLRAAKLDAHVGPHLAAALLVFVLASPLLPRFVSAQSEPRHTSSPADPAATTTTLAPGNGHAPSGEELPAGYVAQADGPVRWTYPVAADDEVRALRNTQAETWRRILGELGTVVDPGLDIRVARNPEEMRALVGGSTPLPGYADGIAFPESGLVLLTLTDPDTFLRPDLHTVLAHELSHVALYRAVGGASVPRWFSEGVAVQQSEESGMGRFRTLWEGTVRGSVLSFDRLARGFPARREEVDIAYAQSADFVGHMLSGKEERGRFRALLQYLRDGQEFSAAVEAAYRVPLSYMEREWRTGLNQRFGRWPMMLMGLTSLWALSAVLVIVAYMRARARHRATLERWEAEERTALAATAALSSVAPANLVDAAPSTPPTGAVQSSLDDFFDSRHAKHEPGVPTIVHDGQSHTLH
jgi:hypothetical protein